MKLIILLVLVMILSCTACKPTGERDFRFAAKKDYHLIYMSCSHVPKSYTDPFQGILKVYMLVFTTDEIDVNGQHFKPRTYYVEKKNITFNKSTEPADSVSWEKVPDRRPDNLTDDTKVVITSDDKIKWDLFDNPCQ